MSTPGRKFEYEVHLGFLVIVFVLLLLNVFANFVVYRARTVQRDHWATEFGTAAVAASREVEQQWPRPLTVDQSQRLAGRFGMSQVLMVTTQPKADSLAARQEWFRSIITELPQNQLPQFVEKLILSDYSRVARGERNEYFFVYPMAERTGPLIILSANVPEMAYLDDSARVLLFFGVGALILVVLIYLVLSRYIFSPFRRIKAVAQRAGRPVGADTDEPDALVAEYQSVIAELKRNEGELRRLNDAITRRADSLEHLHQYILRSMQIGLVTLDTEGKVLEINEFASRMIGVNISAAGRHYTDLFPDLAQLAESISDAIEHGIVHGYQEYSIGLSGSHRTATWGVTLSIIRDQDERAIGLSIWMAEVTELVRLRVEVESKNRLAALGEMASGLAHQLRNSLGAIAGYGTLVKKRLQKAQLPAEPVESLLDESKQAESLISRFLTFARPFDYTPAPVELDTLLSQIVDSCRVRDDFSNIVIATDLKSGATIQADSLLLKQAVGNIIDNAANAYPKRAGLIRVSAITRDDCAVVCIDDEGEGIPPDRVNRIFTPFYSSRPSGTGLGLPLVRKIVDLHNGRISVESTLGKGTCFALEFPLQLANESAAPFLHKAR